MKLNIFTSKPKVVIMTPEQVAEIERQKQATAEILRLEEEKKAEDRRIQEVEAKLRAAEEVRQKNTTRVQELIRTPSILNPHTALSVANKLRTIGRENLANALLAHESHMSDTRKGATAVLKDAYERLYDWSVSGLFRGELMQYSTIAQKISKLTKERDAELAQLEIVVQPVRNTTEPLGNFTGRTHRTEYTRNYDTRYVPTELQITPETLHILRSEIIAKYDPQIIAACKEKYGLETMMHGMYETLKNVAREKGRNMTREMYKKISHEVRKLAYDQRDAKKTVQGSQE